MVLAQIDPFLGEKTPSGCESQHLLALSTQPDLTPNHPPNPGPFTQKSLCCFPLPLCRPQSCSISVEPLPVFGFSSLSKNCSEGAQFFLKSKKQKCLYVGVCLRNNRLLFIKAPFILFAGLCFLSSRGWDGSMEPSHRLQLLISIQGCAGEERGRGRKGCSWPCRRSPRSPRATSSAFEQTKAHFLSRAVLSTK